MQAAPGGPGELGRGGVLSVYGGSGERHYRGSRRGGRMRSAPGFAPPPQPAGISAPAIRATLMLRLHVTEGCTGDASQGMLLFRSGTELLGTLVGVFEAEVTERVKHTGVECLAAKGMAPGGGGDLIRHSGGVLKQQ